MKRLCIAAICLLILTAGPSGAAVDGTEVHVFEFDYDNPIEAPALNVSPGAGAKAPQAPEGSPEVWAPEVWPPIDDPALPAVTPAESRPPAPSVRPGAPAAVQPAPSRPAPSPAVREEFKDGVITIIGEPDPPAPPRSAATEGREDGRTGRPDTGTASTVAPPPAGPEKVVVVKEPRRPRAAPAKGQAKGRCGLDDPRYRFWLLATRTWNLSMGRIAYYRGLGSISGRGVVYPIDQVRFPVAGAAVKASAVAATPLRPVAPVRPKELIDIRRFSIN